MRLRPASQLTEPDFTTRNFRPGDEGAILDLFARSFGHARAPEHWRWKFEGNPWGRHRISLTWAADGQLVAHYAGYPVPFRRFEHGRAVDLLALQIGDTMTARAFRHVGRGPTSLLGRTVAHFYAHHCAGQVAFNYGFNTANIQKFSLLFVGAQRVRDVAYRVAEAERLRSRRLPWWRRYRAEIAGPPGAEYDELLARVGPAYGSLVRRDAEYVRWRYFDCPDPKYSVWTAFRRSRLVGWAAFRQVGADLVWGDALVDPGHTESMGEILRAALASSEVARVSGWFSESPAWWSTWLEAEGFRFHPEPNRLALMCVPFLEPDTPALLGSCYYSQGDGDLF